MAAPEGLTFSQCGSVGQKYCRKDFFGFSFACVTFVNYQFDLIHGYLLCENNSWRENSLYLLAHEKR